MDRALWFVAPRQIALEPVDIPPIEHGDVLVRTACSGVSAGTELLAYRGERVGKAWPVATAVQMLARTATGWEAAADPRKFGLGASAR